MILRCVAVVCVLLAAGCGQRGPLYLPGDASEGRVVLPGEELPAGTEEDPAEGEDGAVEEPPTPEDAEEPATTEDDEQ